MLTEEVMWMFAKHRDEFLWPYSAHFWDLCCFEGVYFSTLYNFYWSKLKYFFVNVNFHENCLLSQMKWKHRVSLKCITIWAYGLDTSNDLHICSFKKRLLLDDSWFCKWIKYLTLNKGIREIRYLDTLRFVLCFVGTCLISSVECMGQWKSIPKLFF